MKNNIIRTVIGLLFLFCFSCKQMNRDDFRGNSYIQGRLFINDNIDAGIAPVLPAPGIKVFIRYADSLSNYIYSVYTDSNGYFLFQNLGSATYIVYANDSLNGVYYYGSDSVVTLSSNALQLNLYPTGFWSNGKGQNGIIFSTYTRTQTDSVPIAGAKIYIYNSRYVAVADSFYTGNGAIDSVVSNANGKVLKPQLPASPDSLFIKAIYTSNGLVYTSSLNGPFALSTVGYINDSIPLTTPNTNLIIVTEDSLGGIIKNVNVFIYGSEIVWSIESADTISGAGALYTAQSNSAGYAFISNIPANTDLYLHATAIIDTVHFKDTTTTYFTLKPNNLDTMVVHLKRH